MLRFYYQLFFLRTIRNMIFSVLNANQQLYFSLETCSFEFLCITETKFEVKVFLNINNSLSSLTKNAFSINLFVKLKCNFITYRVHSKLLFRILHCVFLINLFIFVKNVRNTIFSVLNLNQELYYLLETFSLEFFASENPKLILKVFLVFSPV